MKRFNHAAIFTLVALLLTTPASQATVVVQRNFSEMVNLADLIFAGAVLSIEYKKVNGWIRTFVTFGSVQVLKGEIPGPTYVLQLSGGIIDGIEEHIDGVPEFEIGEREVVFSKDNGRVVSPVVGVWQGRFKVRSINGRQIVMTHSNHFVTGLSKDDLITSPTVFIPSRLSDYRMPPEAGSDSFLDSAEFLKLIRSRLSNRAK